LLSLDDLVGVVSWLFVDLVVDELLQFLPGLETSLGLPGLPWRLAELFSHAGQELHVGLVDEGFGGVLAEEVAEGLQGGQLRETRFLTLQSVHLEVLLVVGLL
jgi:hypothetical protein